MSKLPKEISADDIKYILVNPWNITESEWGLEDPDILDSKLAYISKYLKLTEEGGYFKVWRATDNTPIAILGMFKVADKAYETLFIASKHMEEHSLKLSFEMRKILKETSKAYIGCTLRIYSTSDHPHQITWFRFLGFKYLPDGNIGNTKYFEYSSPAN